MSISATDGGSPDPGVVGVSQRGDGGVSHPERPIARERRGLRQLSHSEIIPGRRSLVDAKRGPRAALQRQAYAAMVRDLKSQYKISIRKWRARMSGVAYELMYSDGRIKRLITAPRPRGPVSAAIFLHEVGHHAVGFRRYAPRCLEEYYVWQWAFREMAARSIPLDQRVLKHYRRSMYHYVRLARREEPHRVPAEVAGFLHWPG